MTHYFGDQTLIEGKSFPIEPLQINILESKVSTGTVIATGKTFSFTSHAIEVTFYKSEIAKFNGINLGAVGAEATAQIHNSGPSNMMKALKKLFPATTIIPSNPAATLTQYQICWSECS
jgi:hypothetical protein